MNKRRPQGNNRPQKAKNFDPKFKEKKNFRENKKPEPIRLNRYIAQAGVCSRREADDLIAEGKISVNGKVVTEMGYKVSPTDKVKFGKKTLVAQKFQYVLLNKPKGFITTMSDDRDRRTVMSLVENACDERIFPVGRLDRNTTGLLLFTNDGNLAKKLTHPSHKVKKIYQVTLNKPITKADFESITAGVELEDGLATVDQLAVISEDNMVLGIEIHIGKNRIVRRIFEHLGYQVEKLDRSMFGQLTKKNLGRGKWRHLNEREVAQLGRK